jgi:hypothetical protein
MQLHACMHACMCVCVCVCAYLASVESIQDSMRVNSSSFSGFCGTHTRTHKETRDKHAFAEQKTS